MADVTISEEEYKSLKNAQRQLILLEDAGVDNWQWYGDALRPYYQNLDGDEEDQ